MINDQPTPRTTGQMPDRLAAATRNAAAPILRLAGAPLDAVKLIAAASMVVDHIYAVLIDHDVMPMWYIGRLAYPLFAFAVACHVSRGVDAGRYVPRLLLLAIISQPFYSITVGGGEGDTIFTLAAGAVVAVFLARGDRRVRHAIFAAVVAAVLVPWVHARSGIDYGLAGAFFPAALVALVNGEAQFLPWALALLVGLNLQPGVSPAELSIATLSGGLGSLAAVGIASCWRGRPRFLPGWALYVFYPAHLAILALLRAAQ